MPLAVLVGVVALAAGQAGPDIKTELFMSHSVVMPGDRVAALVVLRIPEPWHVYWKNPGDSGIPTNVTWQLPPGWKAAPPDFLTPQRFESGGLVSYAFSKELWLRVWLTAPEGAKPGDTVWLKGKVGWLACVESCVLGGAELQASIKIGNARIGDLAGMDALTQFNRAAPKRPPEGFAKVWARADGFDLVIQDPHAQDPYFFAENAEDIDPGAAQIDEIGDLGRILRIPLSTYAVAPPSRLVGILTYTDANGERQAFSLDLPMQPTRRP